MSPNLKFCKPAAHYSFVNRSIATWFTSSRPEQGVGLKCTCCQSRYPHETRIAERRDPRASQKGPAHRRHDGTQEVRLLEARGEDMGSKTRRPSHREDDGALGQEAL